VVWQSENFVSWTDANRSFLELKPERIFELRRAFRVRWMLPADSHNGVDIKEEAGLIGPASWCIQHWGSELPQCLIKAQS
jgi:hypothetical protein